MLLDTASKSLIITAATNMVAAVEYEDNVTEKVIPIQSLVALTGGTDTIVPAPSDGRTARKIKEINIMNNAGSTKTVTISMKVGATTFILKYASMADKSTLHYNMLNGWTLSP